MMVKLKRSPKPKPFVSRFHLDFESFFDSTIQGVKSKLEAKTNGRAAYGRAYRRKYAQSLLTR